MKIFPLVLLAVVAVSAALGAVLFWQRRWRGAPGSEALAKCLATRGVSMYGAYWCAHCQDQKELFGSAFRHVPYVECARHGSREQDPICAQRGITAYPTWVFADGSRWSGVLSLEDLGRKSGCSSP